MPIESNISPLTRKSTPVPNDVASTTAPPKIETEQKLTTIDKVLQNKTVVTAAIKTGLYVPFRDGRLTEQKAVELAYKNDDFKRTLEQELETNHLLDQWCWE